MIGIIDYGTGNLRSVSKAFEYLGYQVKVTADIEALRACKKLVLPGVGAFGDCVKFLKESNLDRFIIDWVESGRVYLGVCLGMQVLFESSDEHGFNEGLGIIKGKVKKFSTELKVPQIGWNWVNFNDDSSLKAEDSYYYFVHSHYCEPENKEDIWASTNYGVDYCSAIAKGNLFAVQFHPEKSSEKGLNLLDNFAKL